MSKSPPMTDSTAQPRKRMEREAREAHIVAEAINFFAEHGLEGKTRDLAARIGITQPLLYRYFPSKESLIERVYQEVYVSRWNPDWERSITDRSQPLLDRVVHFYQEYADAIYDYDWVRIFIFSGLKGSDINDRYIAHVRTHLLEPLCVEFRHEFGLPDPDKVPVSNEEVELVMGLHGMFFYRAIRHFVYNLPMIDNCYDAIERDVRTFIHGASESFKSLVTKNL